MSGKKVHRKYDIYPFQKSLTNFGGRVPFFLALWEVFDCPTKWTIFEIREGCHTPHTPQNPPPCRQNVGPLMSTKNRQRGEPGPRGVGPSQYVDFSCYSISKHICMIRNDSPGSYLEPMRNQTTNFDVPLMLCSKEVRNKNLLRPENVIIDIFLIQYDTNKKVSKIIIRMCYLIRNETNMLSNHKETLRKTKSPQKKL